MLISNGKLMYFGKRREMLSYFAFIEYPCPAYKNPSDYYRKEFFSFQCLICVHTTQWSLDLVMGFRANLCASLNNVQA